MLSESMLNLLNSGVGDLVLVHGKKAVWNKTNLTFENIEGNTVNWGNEPATDIEDKHVRVYKLLAGGGPAEGQKDRE